MRVCAFASLVTFASNAMSAEPAPTGSFTCLYDGTWGCASPNVPGGVCIDSGRPQPRRFNLQLNFESKPFPRLRLNGLDGHLLRDDDSGNYSVVWHLGGLGQPKLSTSAGKRGTITATFINRHANGAYDSSNFKCTRAARPIL
jgi:hypothetical protein